jgi:hypothetical protein
MRDIRDADSRGDPGGEATLGLRYFADPLPDLVSRTIHEGPLLVVCSVRDRLASKRRLTPRALTGEPWVSFPVRYEPPAHSFGRLLEEALRAVGLEGAEIIVIDSLTAQKRFVVEVVRELYVFLPDTHRALVFQARG